MNCKLYRIALFALTFSGTASATPVGFNFDFNFTQISGSYAGDILVGHQVTGSYVYDTDEANASTADTTPGSVPGHEYTSRYTFTAAAYGADFTIPALGAGFNETGDIEVLVNNDLPLTSAETGGFLADGTYDWIELLVSTTIDVCAPSDTCPPNPFTPGDGEEWTLAIFGPASWFSGGSVIPDSLPGTYQALLVGLEFDLDGNEVGAAFASASAVPVPAAAWLFLSGLMGLIGVSRHQES